LQGSGNSAALFLCGPVTYVLGRDQQSAVGVAMKIHTGT
jgi:hypothetical protein